MSAKKKGTKAEPFSIEHFEWWGSRLVLDSGEKWKLEPFQLAFVEDVFKGYSECWLVVPEANGKTTLFAGLGLYGLRYADEAMIPIAASSRDQARILYSQAKGFIRRSRLNTRKLWFEAFDGYRRIDLRRFEAGNKRGEQLGRIEVHAADAGTGDGVIAYPYAFLDELHRHKSLELYEIWNGKSDKRSHQTLIISTAGEPGGDFEEARARIRAAGKSEKQGDTFTRVEHPELVLHEWAVPADGDVNDFDLVARANPFSGVTAAKVERKRSSPTMTEPHYRRFTCNIPTLDEGKSAYIELADWDALEEAEIPRGATVCIGADGSRTWDTTVIAWAQAEDGIVTVDARVFSVRPDIDAHVLHDGGKIDFDDVEAFIIDRFDQFDVLEAAYDPRYLERSMDIVDMRLSEAAVLAVEPSSKHMRDALQTLFNLVAEGKLRHSGDSVLRQHIANTGVERGFSSEIRRVRKIDQRLPIDAVPAMALAVWRAAREEGTVYDSREMVMV